MKILFFSDLHAWVRHGLYGIQYVEQMRGTFSFISGLVREHRPDFVAFLGDVFHTQDSIDVPSLNVVVEGFKEILGAGADVYALTGNHDMYDKGGTVWTSTTALVDLRDDSAGARLHVVSGERLIDLPNGFKILAAPYSEIGYEPVPDVHFMIGHLPVSGAMYEPGGLTEDHGIDPSIDDAPQDAITYVGGHYHHPQVVGQSLIVGAPLYINYKDHIVDKPRGAVLLSLDSVRVPVQSDFQWFENPHARPVATVRAGTHAEAEDQLKSLKTLSEVPVENWTVRVHLPTAEAEHLDGRRVPRGMSVSVIPDDPPSVVARSDITAQTTPEDAFNEYLRQAPPQRLESRVKKAGIEILKQAQRGDTDE